MNQSLPSQYSTANYNGGASAPGGASLKVKLNQLEVSSLSQRKNSLQSAHFAIGNR